MAHVASGLSPDDKPISLVRASDNEKSMQQVGQLLNIIRQASELLVTPDNFEQRVNVDKRAVDCAFETFELAHSRLRDLIDEQVRWSLHPTPTEIQSGRLIDASTGLTEAKEKNVREYNRPSVFLRPNLRRFDIGWVCWLGDDEPKKSHLHGIGASPLQAMLAFDRAYDTLEKATTEQKPIVIPVPPPKPSKPAKSRKKK